MERDAELVIRGSVSLSILLADIFSSDSLIKHTCHILLAYQIGYDHWKIQKVSVQKLLGPVIRDGIVHYTFCVIDSLVLNTWQVSKESF